MKKETSLNHENPPIATVSGSAFCRQLFFVWMSIPEIEKIINDKYAPITAFGCIFYVALVTVAIFKYYR